MPWLAFHNNYGLTVSVAVMQDACGGEYGGWATHGWWNLNPGESNPPALTAATVRHDHGLACAVHERPKVPTVP
jgi:hypothetical protein